MDITTHSAFDAEQDPPPQSVDERLADVLGPVLAGDRALVLADLVAGTLGRGERVENVERALRRWRGPRGEGLEEALVAEAMQRGAFWHRLRPGLDDQPRIAPQHRPLDHAPRF